MIGPYGGVLELHDGVCRERASSDLLQLLVPVSNDKAGAQEDRAVVPTEPRIVQAIELFSSEPVRSACITLEVRGVDGRLEYDASLVRYGSLADIRAGSHVLELLAQVAEHVASLHAGGRVHGDLRFGTVLCGEMRAALVMPPVGVNGAALLAARLRSGAYPTEVAFVAPEVVHGGMVSPATDVYSLAALAFAAISRRAPLALVDARDALRHLDDDIADSLIAALDPRPERRPDARTLARTLREAVPDQRSVESNDDAVPRTHSSLLGALLVVAAVAVFSGIFALAVARWEHFDHGARLALFTLFTLAVFGSGALLIRFNNVRSGIGLCVLATQLLWADGWILLSSANLAHSYAAWAVTAAAIGGIQYVLGARLGWMPMGAFGALAFTICAVTLGLFLPLGVTHGPWVFAALTAVGYLLASRSLSRWQTIALPLTLTSGLWFVASGALSLLAVVADDLIVLAWPYVLASLLFAVALRSQGVQTSVLGITSFALALLAPTLQALVLLEHSITVHAAAVATSAIAVAASNLRNHTGYAARLATLRIAAPSWLVAPSLPAAGWTLGSAITSLAAASTLHSIWVYVVASICGISALLAKQSRALLASRVLASAALAVLVIAPSAQSLLFRDQIAVLFALVLLGVALVAVAALKQSPGNPAWPPHLILVGLAAATLSPLVLALIACMGHRASELFVTAAFGVHERWVYLALSMGVSCLLLGIAIFSHNLRREWRRAIEFAGIALGPGVLFLLSLPIARDDLFYSSLLLLFSGACLVISLSRRRLMLAATSTALVLVVLCIQYFAKLTQTVHWGLLAVGFGLSLFCVAAVYERKVRRLLSGLGDWD